MVWASTFQEKPYLEQFERIKRWYDILNQIKNSNSPENQADYQVDCIYTFFMNCFHLKDWLINSNVDQNAIHKYINENKELKICRDICNGAKHLKLTNPSIGKGSDMNMGLRVTLHKEYDPYHEVTNNTKPLDNATYVIVADFEKFNVFDLSDKCMELWEDFLKINALL